MRTLQKTLLLITSFIALTGCQSNEKKAIKLIENDLSYTLRDFESYEAIETEVDSLIANPYNDYGILSTAFEYIAWEKEFDDFLEEFEDKLDSYRIRAIGNGAVLKEWKKYNEQSKEIIDEFKAVADSLETEIVSKSKELKPEFVGWAAKHRFRANNGNGAKNIYEYYYFFDKDITKIVNVIDSEDEDYAEAIELISDMIE